MPIISDRSLLKLVKNRGDVIYTDFIRSEKIIIDFYNFYCCFVHFAKYNKFSKATFLLCMKKIITSLPQNKEIYIVSKPIFEISEDDIKASLKPNIKFVIITDLHTVKSNNKERDDYFCLLLHNHFNEENIDSCILTNDKYSNFASIKMETKPFNARIFNGNGVINSINITDEILNDNNLPKKIKKFGFSFKKR